MANPLEEDNDLTVAFQSSHFTKELFYEWIKTLGTVVNDKVIDSKRLKLPNSLDHGIPFTYSSPYTGGGIVKFEFRDDAEKTIMLPLIRGFLRKVSACIDCRSCETECSFGAIGLKNGKLKINGDKCVKCRKCYAIEKDCWRFKSMYKSENDNNKMSGINRYNNFGLRGDWLAHLIDMGESFFPWTNDHPLGRKMVESASAWFHQAGLIQEKTRKPTALVDLFKKYGAESPFGWEFIWLSLANNAVLVKWFVMANDIYKTYTIEQLSEMLSNSNPSLGKSTIDGGLAALKDMLTKSPLGGENRVTLPEMKGKVVKSITRKAKDLNPLTILYGLYLIADKAQRGSFTIRELLTADIESTYVSPIVAFGISPDTFKKQCEGLKSRYPDYIETTFTFGLDELTLFPKKHTTEEIIRLALEE